MRSPPECRAAVLLSMVQTLSVKYGIDCIGTENERRRLAQMGPEERFQALQIEFISLTYRLETQETELHETRERLKAMTEKLSVSSALQSAHTTAEFELKVIADFKRSHAAEAIEMQTALERDRQKLKSAINADLMDFIPKQHAALLDDLLLEAGVNPKDSSTRTRLHGLLSTHREQHMLYPADETGVMVAKIKGFARDNRADFEHVTPTPFGIKLPWESAVGGKRKHPVDKVWDWALDDLGLRCQSFKRHH